jgi:tryptophan synthase alpha chain
MSASATPLAAAFASARVQRRAAFVAYVMAGDPDLPTSGQILAALGDAGTDVIELGIPYGDPLADGPTIAAAGQRALAAGTRIADVWKLVRDLRSAGGPPVVLFTYFNPVYQYGAENFARDAAAAGASGAIVPDVTLEETDAIRTALSHRDLEMPLLIAPSTPPARAERIAKAAGGFVYVVSRLGVTGAADAPDAAPLARQLGALRDVTDKPLAVGFGLSRPEHVRAIAPLADGVVVGSALIDAYAGRAGADAAARVGELARSLRAAAAR